MKLLIRNLRMLNDAKSLGDKIADLKKMSTAASKFKQLEKYIEDGVLVEESPGVWMWDYIESPPEKDYALGIKFIKYANRLYTLITDILYESGFEQSGDPYVYTKGRRLVSLRYSDPRALIRYVIANL